MYIIIIAYVFVLLYFPGFSDNTIIKTIPFFLLLFLSIKYQNFTQSFTPFFGRKNFLLIILIFIIFIDTLRSGNLNISFLNTFVRSATLFLFIFSLYHSIIYYFYVKGYSLIKLFYLMAVTPFVIYSIANVALWAANVRVKSTEELQIGSAVILSSFGITVERVSFPLAAGINSYGAVVGGVLTVLLILLFNYKKYKLFSAIGICTMFLTLLLTDTRSAIAYPVFISLLITFLIRRRKELKNFYLKLIPIIPIMGPFLLMIILSILSQTSIGASLSRSSEDLATGNSRLLIWSFSVLHFLDFRPIHIIGYGEYGHYTSGVSKNWGFLFNAWENGDLTHPHHTILAILFDYGYLGVTIFLAFQFKIINAIKKMWASNQIVASCILGYLIYFNLISITESFFEFYYLNSIYIFFSMTTFVVASSATATKNKLIKDVRI